MTAKKKAPAKKAAAKKTAAKKPMQRTSSTPAEAPAPAPAPEPERKPEPQPMDPEAVESSVPVGPVANRQRNAYALDTLIEEVLSVFPETTYEVSGYNAFNTALHVVFHTEEFERLDELISMVADDHRIEEVLYESEDRTILVALRPNLRTQDLRTPFHLPAAWTILSEKYGDAR